MTTSPQRVQRRPLDFRSFDDVVADIDRLRSAGYDRAGTWDLRQCCDHLGRFMTGSLSGFGFRFPWYFRIAAPLLLRHTLKSRRIPAGVKGPPSLMPASADVDESTAAEACRRLLFEVRDHGGAFHPSPLFGRLAPEQWRQLHLIHASHHLSFLVPRGG